MTAVLALDVLHQAVVARFAAEASPPEQPFGWREPAKKLAGRRIVWVPGDDGALGELAPARHPGRNPRSLGTIHELVTVYVEAFDVTAPENEKAQYIAVRLLLDAFLKAVYLAAHGTYRVRSMRWVTETANARRAGAAVRVVLDVDAMVPDVEAPTITGGSTTTLTMPPTDTDTETVTTTEDP